MQGAPCLSVLLSSYNYGHFIGDAIRSVLEQDFEDYELIIVDNASTDNSLEIISSFNDPRIRLIVNPSNLGPHKSMEIMLHNAKGKYVRMLCADDVLLPGTMRKQVECLNNYPCVNLVTCDFIVTDSNLNYTSIYSCCRGFANGDDVIYSCLSRMKNEIGNPSSVMFRAEDLKNAIVDKNLHLSCDVDFCIQILKKGCYYNLRMPGIYYRRHEKTDTKRVWSRDTEAREWLYLIKKHGVVTPENIIRLIFIYRYINGIPFLLTGLAKFIVRPKLLIRSLYFMLANAPHGEVSLLPGGPGKL